MSRASSSEPALTSTVVAKEYARWSPQLRQEFVDNTHNARIGKVLLKETDSVRVWETTLQPEERIPVHRHVVDYTWIALTDGRARQHNSDGTTREISYVRGQTLHFRCAAEQYHLHDFKNIGDGVLSFLVVEERPGANEPLPLA